MRPTIDTLRFRFSPLQSEDQDALIEFVLDEEDHIACSASIVRSQAPGMPALQEYLNTGCSTEL